MSDIPEYVVNFLNDHIDSLLTPEMSKEDKIKLCREKMDDLVKDMKQAAEAKLRLLKNS